MLDIRASLLRFGTGLACAGVLACTSSTPTGATTSAETSTPEPSLASGSASAKPASSWGRFPSAARRDSPPPGIETRVLDKGAIAPPIMMATSRDTWSLSDALAKSQHVVLIFFRGAW